MADLLDMSFRPSSLVLLLAPFKIIGYAAVHDLVPQLEMVLEGISFRYLSHLLFCSVRFCPPLRRRLAHLGDEFREVREAPHLVAWLPGPSGISL